MRSDDEINRLTAPLLMKLMEASSEASCAVAGVAPVALFSPQEIADLNRLADQILGQTSGYELFVAARSRGIYGGSKISTAEAQAAFPTLTPAEQTQWMALGFWSDLLNGECRRLDEAALRNRIADENATAPVKK